MDTELKLRPEARSGFQQDVNVCFPLEHLHTLAPEGVIGGVSRWHYVVVGAAALERLEEAASETGRLLSARRTTWIGCGRAMFRHSGDPLASEERNQDS